MARQNTKRPRTQRTKHARKATKARLRALLLEGAASRAAGKADRRHFAGLREAIRAAASIHPASGGPEELKLFIRATARVHRDLNTIAQRVDAAHLHLAVLLAMLKTWRGRRDAKADDKKWNALQTMLDRPARRNPRLVRLLKTKPPWD